MEKAFKIIVRLLRLMSWFSQRFKELSQSRKLRNTDVCLQLVIGSHIPLERRAFSQRHGIVPSTYQVHRYKINNYVSHQLQITNYVQTYMPSSSLIALKSTLYPLQRFHSGEISELPILYIVCHRNCSRNHKFPLDSRNLIKRRKKKSLSRQCL